MDELISEFRKFIIGKSFRLHSISEEMASFKSSPEKWSKKEIIGHLIDSASNNHQRFIRACFKNDLVFPGYNQDEWVKLQNYQAANWDMLIDLWSNFNLQIAHCIENLPEEIKTRKVKNHNFHEIAWQPIPKEEPSTLGYFIVDYIGHLKYHINGIFSE